MSGREFSLRERKYGDNRYKIMLEVQKRLTDEPLHAIFVEDICQAAGISKVTFFKYFPSKEAVVYYAVMKWEYERSYELSRNLYHGRKGIERVFESISEEPYALHLMLSLTQYLSRGAAGDIAIAITPYEYSLFSAEAFVAGTEHKSLAQIIAHYVGELDVPAKRESICKLLIAILYGAPVIAKACTQSNGLKAAYRENVGLIFCGLGVD